MLECNATSDSFSITQIFRSYNVESQYEIVVPNTPPPIIAMSYFCITTIVTFNYVKAPGERFELSIPCENALYGKLFPGARPTRLGDPGILFANKFPNILL